MADLATTLTPAPIDEKLAGLSDVTLQDLWSRVDREMARRRVAAQRAALEDDRQVAEQRRDELAIRAAARAADAVAKGVTAAEIESGTEIYRSPADPTQIWRGLGRRPTWLKHALARKGVTLKSLKSTWTTEDARAASQQIDAETV